MDFYRLLYCILLAIFITSCNQANIPLTLQTSNTPIAKGNEQCPFGGNLFNAGLDSNSNGVLDASEVSESQQQCYPNDQFLVQQIDFAPDSRCAYGGSQIDTGIDTNSNQQLDNAEISATKVVCQENHIKAQVGQLPLATANCIYGGLTVETYRDENENNQLDVNELIDSSEHCYTFPTPPENEDLGIFLNRMRFSQYSHDLDLYLTEVAPNGAYVSQSTRELNLVMLEGVLMSGGYDKIGEKNIPSGQVSFVEYLKNDVVYGIYSANNLSQVSVENYLHPSNEMLSPIKFNYSFRDADFAVFVFPNSTTFDVTEYAYVAIVVPDQHEIQYQIKKVASPPGNSSMGYQYSLINTENITQFRAISFLAKQPVSNQAIYDLVDNMFTD